MNKLIRSEDQHYDVWLQWNLTSQCNFGCTYCFGKTQPNKQTINQIKIDELINALDADGRTFRIGFTGGEPFLIPNFIEACKVLTEEHFISFNSNLILNSVETFANSINPKRVLNIHASLHFEELKKKDKFERFVSNYGLLHITGFNIYDEAVAYPDMESKLNEYRELTDRYELQFRFAPFFGEYDGKFYPESYSSKQIKAFNLDPDDLAAHYQLGNRCNAGFNAAVVSPMGKISPCFNLSGNLGHIYESINLNNSPMVCPASKCVCPLNHYDKYLFNKTA